MASAGGYNPEPVDVPDRCELIIGKITKIRRPTAYSQVVVNRLNRLLNRDETNCWRGRPRIGMYFRVPTPDDPTRIRRAQIAIISFDTSPVSKPLSYTGNAVDFVPELITEVVSPTDDAEDVIEKMRDYLRVGVRSVWIVYPRSREIHCFDADGTAHLTPQPISSMALPYCPVLALLSNRSSRQSFPARFPSRKTTNR